MLTVIKLLLAKFLLARYAFGTIGSLVVVLPVAAILKAIGAPLMAILGVVAAPVLIILAIVGLPLLAVLVCAAVLIGLVAMVMVLGLVALKVFLFVVLPIALMVWIVRRLRGSAPSEVPSAV